MESSTSNTVQLAADHVSAMFEGYVDASYSYHNLAHTQQVVEAATQLAQAVNLREDEVEQLLVAAWFHDVGYCEGHLGHELVSARLVESFLEEQGWSDVQIAPVANAIKSTLITIEAESQLDKLLCDADLSYLGLEGFQERILSLRQEWEVTLSQQYSEKEWLELNVHFLSTQRYYTEAGFRLFDVGKQKHILKLQQQLNLL